MCGIAGFVGGKWSGRAQAASVAARMGGTILHRGPDHSDVWIDEDARVAFAHNRLSILDLSAAGNQPMASHSGRYVIVYNGEAYNHQQVRDELTEAGVAPNWNGHSDTETLLAAIEAWGVRGALDRSTGMFALALWDKAERTLNLARDRLGEKPLYYGRQEPGGPFFFASELKALMAHPQFRGDIDRQALTLLLRYNYVLQSPILTDGPRMVRTPTYYAFMMYVPFQGASALPVQVHSPVLGSVPAIDVTAAKGEGGAVYVGLVNADPDEAADVELSVAGIGRHVAGQLLTAPAMDSRNRFGAAEEVHPVPFKGARWSDGKLRVALPARSIVVLNLK